MMITGGSDALCGIVGRGRYQLILGFLPLVCAISGNAALQSREVAIRAITNGNPTSKINKRTWFIEETIATTCHGVVMGIAVGIVACVVSGWDIVFGVTMLLVQLCSTLSAGMTGTVVPLLCNCIMKREPGQWITLVVTAIQDIFGSFITIVLTYYTIAMFSAKDVDATDRCISTVSP